MTKTFWLLLTVACVAWYSIVTLYVAIKGAVDIKQMLARLAAGPAEGEDVTDTST